MGGHHPCSNSIQGNGFTRDDFWVVLFLKPIVFSSSFSEHSSPMTWGRNIADNSPNVYKRQKKQDLLSQQQAGAEVRMQTGSRLTAWCSQLIRTARLKGTSLWPPLPPHFLFLSFFFSFGMSGPSSINFQCVTNPHFRGSTLPFCQPVAAPCVQPI